MKLKTLLLGTAAIMLASATSANAVKAHSATPSVKNAKKNIVVAKNACSAFGDDFFNIPGTSSCIKIYGKIVANISSNKSPSEVEHHIDSYSQGRLGFEAMTPSNLGNMHLRFEARGDVNFVNDKDEALTRKPNTIHFAYAEVGGLRFGIDESIFNYWADNFGTVENDGALNPRAGEPLEAISYTLSNKKGFSGILGLERYGQDMVFKDHVVDLAKYKQTGNASIIAGAKYQQPWGAIIGVAAYDGNFKKASAKLRIEKNINNKFNVFALGAYKSVKDDLTIVPSNAKAFHRESALSPYGDWDGKWEAIAGASYILTPNLAFNTQLGYTEAKTASASAGFAYQIAKGFTITPELAYMHWGDNEKTDKLEESDLKGKHAVSGLVKLSYKF